SHLFSYKRIFGATTKIEPPSRPLSSWDDPTFKPYFDDNNVDNVTTQLGKTAHLHCKIRQLGDRTVSWVRQKDLHILTVGRYTYTSDQRFTCIHLDDSDDWTLEIKYVQKDDAGIYECQVSTEPKMSLSIKLGVVAAKAIIPEGPELFVEVGVTVNLTCLISEPSSSPPVYVFWYHDGTVINYDSPRGGDIKVTTDRSSSAVSRLTIIESRPSDSGEYSCKPSYADFANATLHVVAASSSSPSSSLSSIALDKKDFPGELTPFYQYPASLGTSLFQYHHQYYINWSIYFFGWLVIYRSK
ncbi:lachesin, partial [Tetranychus urticae]|uniref:lachesin n=1 Tax=Tetranychus urticae TaxID=32264 RepID=UPI00077BC126